jgi:hypothetical protein
VCCKQYRTRVDCTKKKRKRKSFLLQNVRIGISEQENDMKYRSLPNTEI